MHASEEVPSMPKDLEYCGPKGMPIPMQITEEKVQGIKGETSM
jgi:hypothetical protein